MKKRASIVFIFTLFSTSVIYGFDNNLSDTTKLKKTLGTPSITHLNINNISTFVYNDGITDRNTFGNSGLEFPKGTKKQVMFQSGLIWGAIIDGEKHVGGSTYNTGLLPGRIIGFGDSASGEDENSESVRIYRVRRNLADGFESELNDNEGTSDEIIKQYEKDRDEWPADFGAPFEDIDNNGIYDPSIDTPGFPGADQTIWYVANDLDTATCKNLYDSNPMGIELQVTFWAYNSGADIGNTIFRKYKLINKSNNNFDSMYISIWADPDLGDASDDFVGCDTSLSLMYTYNGVDHDNVFGNNTPSVGFDFFQGPIIPSPGDTAIFDGKIKPDFRNLEISAHYYFVGGDPYFRDPPLGTYDGTLQFFNLFKGRISLTGAPMIDPITGKATKFALSGNPITGEGWIDGILSPPSDKRQGMVAGPFTMASGDTQEVVVAFIGAFGENRLDAITKLKERDYYIQKVYDSNYGKIETVPNPPIVPGVTIKDGNTPLLLWNQTSEIENFDQEGYKFQGYNIFQIDNKSIKLVATFDIVDGIKTISQFEYDSNEEKEIIKDVQFGTDSGLKYEFEIEKDYINNSKLLKGKKYSFAVVAYTYNPDESKRIKTTSSIRKFISFKYLFDNYGFNFGEKFEINHIAGNSDTEIKVTAYDDDLITGNDYEISFSEQYYNYENGEWIETDVFDSTKTRREYYWNVLNKTTNRFVLTNQRVYEGKDFYANFWDTDSFVGNPVVDGLEMSCNYNFDLPITIYKIDEKSSFGYYLIKDYKYYGWSKTAYSTDTFGNGVTSIDILKKDYELRFTGEYKTPDANGIIYIKEGTGSVATLYGARNYSLADHPMNPNPGSDSPFLVRIPFEIWNNDDNRQVNLLIYDRMQHLDDNPFYAFNPNDRMYCEINNTEYNSQYANSGNPDFADTDSLTWNLVFQKTNWEKNDKVKIIYNNPIQIGIDKYAFSTLVEGKNTITNYSLLQNYPNPFNPTTQIRFIILNDTFVNITVYDILGREVTTLVNKEIKKGEYSVKFDGSSLVSGVYIYRISAGDFNEAKKMVLLK